MTNPQSQWHKNSSNMVSFIIPSRNNLAYLQLAYSSIRRYYPEYEITILDDNSTDGTHEWIMTNVITKECNTAYYRNQENQVGHTVLYDKGVEMCSNEIFTIFHADMVCGPNYVENLTKHLKPGTVVSATRIEPPLHPPGKEKIVMDFGMYAEDFKHTQFAQFCLTMQHSAGETTKGIFAPWMMYKKDFLAIGGHDKYFAPFPFEDSDIFQRFILNGYKVVQSRDAFVYHFTCRGHRWTKEVKKDDHFYKLCVAKNQAYYIRKWGSWIANDEYSCPIIHPKYNIGFRVKNCNFDVLGALEPWCSTIYTDCPDIQRFIQMVQPGTPFFMPSRVQSLYTMADNDIIVSFDGNQLTQEKFNFITQLPQILKESGEVGEMEHDIFRIEIRNLNSYEVNRIKNDDFYKSQYKFIRDEKDPYCLKELFKVYSNTK
jgi:glycosyltransferase involved in cell wall biosynthesis